MSDELRFGVAAFPLDTRMRWYKEMNCWVAPADFPVSLEAHNGDHARISADAVWQAAWAEVQSSLSPAEQSLGWWIYDLGKTPAEWRTWWIRDRKKSPASADAAINAYTAATGEAP